MFSKRYESTAVDRYYKEIESWWSAPANWAAHVQPMGRYHNEFTKIVDSSFHGATHCFSGHGQPTFHFRMGVYDYKISTYTSSIT